MPRSHPEVLQHTAQGWRIHGPARLDGRLRPPADKSLLHRAVLLAALGEGTSLVRGVAGEDVMRTEAAMRQLGVPVTRDGDLCRIEGRGLHGLRCSRQAIDCGNSGTTMRLLGGVLAAQPFRSWLTGDASLLRRPMRRIAEPLREMGAHIHSAGDAGRPPLRVGRDPHTPLQGCVHHLPVDSAQVRSALLLAGLTASGATRIAPASAARDHTQRMLRALGVLVRDDDEGTLLYPNTAGESWPAFDWHVPGDASAAAFFIALASAQRGARLQVQDCSLNPGRVRYLDILSHCGAGITRRDHDMSMGEPRGDLQVRGRTLNAIHLRGQDVVACIDDIPALVAAAAIAGSAATLCDADELRLKESDRIAALGDVLQRFAVPVHTRRDGLTLQAGTRLQPAQVDSHGDHRIAMVAALLASQCDGVSLVRDVDCVATSYPGFAADFNRMLIRHSS